MRTFLSFALFVVAVFSAVVALEMLYHPGAWAVPGVDTTTLQGAYQHADQMALPHTRTMMIDVVASLGHSFGDASQFMAGLGNGAAGAMATALTAAGINPGPVMAAITQLLNAPAALLAGISAALEQAVR